MADFSPLPPDPTNADLAECMAKLHDCGQRNHDELVRLLSIHAQEDANTFALIKNDLDVIHVQNTTSIRERGELKVASRELKVAVKGIARRQTAVIKSVSSIVESQDTIQSELGLKGPKNKPIALMSQFELGWKLAAGVGVVVGTWKFVAFAIPFIALAVLGFWHFILALNNWIVG